MHKRVDIDEDDSMLGFSYQSASGGIEFVHILGKKHVSVENDMKSYATFCVVDIPNLIKALSAAYAHTKGE